MILRKGFFENIEEKGENANNHHVLHAPQHNSSFERQCQ